MLVYRRVDEPAQELDRQRRRTAAEQTMSVCQIKGYVLLGVGFKHFWNFHPYLGKMNPF